MAEPGDDRARRARAMHEQGFDPDPPRCGTCVYYTRGSAALRRLEAKRGRGISHLQRCTFGNFLTTYLAVCDEWHSRHGEKIDESTT